jgi:hypothetical protein
MAYSGGTIAATGFFMNDGSIPKRVQDFIAQHIGSVAHLEILLLMRQRRSEHWSAATVSAELRTSVDAAADILNDLHASNQLVVSHGSPATYTYRPAPGSPDDTVVAELAKAYAERRFTVIDLIFSKPLKRVQLFADAFRLWKDPKKDENDA